MKFAPVWRIQEDQSSAYSPFLSTVLNSLVVCIDLGEESHPSLISIRSEATVHIMVYSGPTGSQHRFSPNSGLLGNVVKMSASALHSVSDILSVLGGVQSAGQARELKLLQGIEENEHVKPKCLRASACSQHRAIRKSGNYGYVLSSSFCPIPLPPKLSSALRVSCKQNRSWQNFCFHTRLSSVLLNEKPGKWSLRPLWAKGLWSWVSDLSPEG